MPDGSRPNSNRQIPKRTTTRAPAAHNAITTCPRTAHRHARLRTLVCTRTCTRTRTSDQHRSTQGPCAPDERRSRPAACSSRCALYDVAWARVVAIVGPHECIERMQIASDRHKVHLAFVESGRAQQADPPSPKPLCVVMRPQQSMESASRQARGAPSRPHSFLLTLRSIGCTVAWST